MEPFVSLLHSSIYRTIYLYMTYDDDIEKKIVQVWHL